MSNDIRTGQETEAEVGLCPQCGSAVVETTTKGNISDGIDTNRAYCGACGWQGIAEDLVAHRFKHEHGTDDQIAQQMVEDLRNHIARDLSLSLGRYLTKWGFVSPGVTPQVLSRYIVGAAQAVMKSILETRQQLEREKHGS